jgi:hypothetical protein
LDPKWTPPRAHDRGSDARNHAFAGVSLYRRPLLKASHACFKSVVLEDHAFERIEAAIEIVHARPGAFEQRVPPTG